MVTSPRNRNYGERCGEVCWGVGGGQGSCGKRCREMCWGVGGGKERCVGSGEVSESVWGEWGRGWESVWRVGKGCGEKNGGGVVKCVRVWGPNTLPHISPSPHLSLHLPLPPPHPNTLSYPSLSHLFPHLAPHPFSPHLLKVWQSF